MALSKLKFRCKLTRSKAQYGLFSGLPAASDRREKSQRRRATVSGITLNRKIDIIIRGLLAQLIRIDPVIIIPG